MVTTLLGSEISSSQWECPTMHSRCHNFVQFNVWVGGRGGGFFFSFFPGSQCVPQHVLHSTSLLALILWQILSSFHPFMWAKEKEPYTSE
jgi:hypothetical protein